MVRIELPSSLRPYSLQKRWGISHWKLIPNVIKCTWTFQTQGIGQTDASSWPLSSPLTNRSSCRKWIICLHWLRSRQVLPSDRHFVTPNPSALHSKWRSPGRIIPGRPGLNSLDVAAHQRSHQALPPKAGDSHPGASPYTMGRSCDPSR
jgi:hypothetical protein